MINQSVCNQLLNEIHTIRDSIHQAHHENLDELIAYFQKKEIEAQQRGFKFVSFPPKLVQTKKSSYLIINRD